MKKYRDMPIRVKLPALIGIAGITVFVVVSMLLLVPLRTLFFRNASEIARLTALEAGKQLAQRINSQASVVRAFSGAVELLIKTDIVPTERKREWMLAEIEYMISQSEQLSNLWVVFEPNALDGLDEYFEGRTDMGSNSKGVFVPWIVDGKFIVAEDDYKEPYYKIPQETLREAISEPYWENVDSKKVHMFSISRPIVIDGKFYGVAGTDFYIDELNEMIKALNLNNEGKLKTNQGTVVVFHDYSMLGQQAKDITEEILEKLADGELFDRIYKIDGKKIYKVFVPIQLGEDTAPWFYVVDISARDVYAKANRMIAYLLVVCTIGGIMIAFSGCRLLRPMLCDVSDVSNIVKKLSQGRITDLQITSGQNNDEFGKMKTDLNSLLESLKRAADFALRISEGKFDTELNLMSDADIVGTSLLEMRQSLKNEMKKMIYWYEFMLDSFTDTAISVTDKDQNITFVNKKACEIIGKNRDKIIGMNCNDVWGIDICTDEYGEIKFFKRGDKNNLFYIGSEIYTATASHLKDASGNDMGHVKIISNITGSQQKAEYNRREVAKLADNILKLSKGDVNINFSIEPPNEYTSEEFENFCIIASHLEKIRKEISWIMNL